jgi:hypothetical protein
MKRTFVQCAELLLEPGESEAAWGAGFGGPQGGG